MRAINTKAVEQLCKIVGLKTEAVKDLEIKVELPGIVTVKTEYYLLAEDETIQPTDAKKNTTKRNAK